MAKRHEHGSRERESERRGEKRRERVGRFGGVAAEAELMKFTHIPKIREKA